MLASWLTIIVVVSIAYAATHKMKFIPGRMQGIVEVGLETLINFVESVAGKKHGRRFLPIVGTIFIFVIFNARLILAAWLGEGYVESVLVIQILALGYFINVITGVAHTSAVGMGKPEFAMK